MGMRQDAVERALNDKPYFQGPKYKVMHLGRDANVQYAQCHFMQ